LFAQMCIIIRLLDKWEVLKSYFILATVEDKVKSAELILEYLKLKLLMIRLKRICYF